VLCVHDLLVLLCPPSTHHLARVDLIHWQGLDGFKRYNHGNVAVQATSLRLLADGDAFPFTWILPGHGRMVRISLVVVHR